MRPVLSAAVTACLLAAAVVLCWAPDAAVAAAEGCDFLPPDTARSYGDPNTPILVGALGIKGKEKLFEQFNETFSTYLTETAGAALGGRNFEMVYVDFSTAYQAAEYNCVDFLFVQPSMFSCLEMQFGVTAISTLVNFRKGYELDRFYGAIFTRADRADIQTLEDLKGQVVEAVSVAGLGACQLQRHELLENDIDFFNDPKQVRFSKNQQLIVHDVIAGLADVGMVRADLPEEMANSGSINGKDLKVINLKNDDPAYPFPFSTSLAAPEWPLAVLKATPDAVVQAVAQSLFELGKEDKAPIKGKYAGWRSAISYLQINRMMYDLQWIREGKCFRGSDTYDAIACPHNHIKLPMDKIDEACALQAVEDERYACPEGYICVCRPCYQVPQKQIVIQVLQQAGAEASGAEASGLLDQSKSPVPEEACNKLQTCAKLVAGEEAQVLIFDNWHDIRGDLGLRNVSTVRYRWWPTASLDSQDGQAVEWKYAMPVQGVAGQFTLSVSSDTVGSHLLDVEVQTEDGVMLQAEDNPVIFAVVSKSNASGIAILASSVIACVLVLFIAISLSLLIRNYKLKNRIESLARGLVNLDIESPLAKILDFLKQYEKSGAVIRGPSRATASALRDLICHHNGSLATPDLRQQLHRVSSLESDAMTRHLVETTTSETFGFGDPRHSSNRTRAVVSKLSLLSHVSTGRGSDHGMALSGVDSAEVNLLSAYREESEHIEHTTRAIPLQILQSPTPALMQIPPKLVGIAGRDYFMDFITVSSKINDCPSPLALVAKASVESLGLGSVLGRDGENRLVAYAMHIEKGYPVTGYHCRIHAADVTNRMVSIMAKIGITLGRGRNGYAMGEWMTAALTAAMMHDYDHPHVSNQYMVARGFTLAKQFNDQAVAENHSLRCGLGLLEHDETNFLSEWNPRSRAQLRNIIIQTVLATDMSRHFDIVTQFNAKVLEASELHDMTSSQKWDKMSSVQKLLTLQMAIKVSDLGACALPLEQHMQWIERLQAEFFRQGDMERKNGMPPSILMDRRKPGVQSGKNQASFFKIIVLPLIRSWVAAFPECQSLLDQAEANFKHWESTAAADALDE